MGKNVNQLLAANLEFLMRETPALATQAQLAAKSGVDQKTISNYLAPDNRPVGKKGRPASAKLTEVELIARAFKLEAWELLHPELTRQKARREALAA